MLTRIAPVDIPVEDQSGAAAPIVDKEVFMNNWKYKIDVQSMSLFEEIENQYNVKFVDELRDFISMHNAATPEKYHFMIGNTEKVLGAILSVNKGESDTDTIYTALSCIENSAIIPFAIDPFGNYICYSSATGKIVFWDHETNAVLSSEKNLTEYIDSLY